ncbi:MAG TPA: cytochrome c [Verrucomicrobiae bacterium]|jgi:mono/diheme cytochrome c family protein|nr:cytochrome c [Verrucomicrobiae bacterium]
MKLSPDIKGAVLGTVSALAAIGIAFAAAPAFQSPPRAASPGASEALMIPPEGTAAREGYTLFMMNCAHCHGNDARGDEGPDLHGITKSDARISSMVKNGIKDEMPKFGSKLTDSDIKALIAFVRTLND